MNALNSILSFMQRPVAIEAFEREGIRVWADEAKTQFRNVIEIFQDLAARWPQMSQATQDMFVQAAEQAGLYSEELADVVGLQKEFNDVQQRDLSQAMAGIYRRNYLLALLQNWAKIDQVLISMEDSLGYSMKENERTMETLAKQWEALKAAAEELAVAIGDAGLLDQLKSLVEGARDAVTWFNNFDPTLRNLIITFTELTVVMKALSVVMNMAGISSIGSVIAGWAVPITATTAATRTLVGSMTLLKTLITNITRGFMGLFGGPWGFAFTAAAAGVITLVNALRQAHEEQMKYGQSMAEIQDKLQEYQNILNSASPASKEYQDALKQQSDMLQQVGIQYPELIKTIDEHGRVLEIDRDRVAQLAQQYKQLSDNQKDATDKYNEALQASNKRIVELEQEAGRYESSINTLKDLINYYQQYQATTKATGAASKELGQIEEGIKGIVGEAGLARLKAAGFTQQAIDVEVAAIKEKARVARENAVKEKDEQIKLTNQVIEETKQRIEAYRLEAEALAQGRASNIVDYLKAWGKAFLNTFPIPDPFLFKNNFEEAMRQLATEDYQKMAQENLKLQDLEKQLTQLQQERAQITAESIGKDKEQTGIFIDQEDALSKLNDALEEHLNLVERMVKQYQDYVNETEALLDITKSQIDYYNREGASLEDRLIAYEFQAESIGLLLTKQDDLYELIGANKTAIADLKSTIAGLGQGINTAATSVGKLSGSLEDYFNYASQATGVSVNLLKAVAQVESGFNQAARSPAGAIGIMQLMPGTAKGLGVNPYDLGQNILGGAKYLQQALETFNGNLQLALAAYNAGTGRVQSAIRKAGSSAWESVKRYLPGETQSYVSKVLGTMGGSSNSGVTQETDKLEQEYKRRQDIQEKYADSTTQMYQDIYRAQADWWRAQKEIGDLVISNLEYVRALRQHNIDAVKGELDYLTRDTASQEDLARAYAVNANYLSLMNEKRLELQNKIRDEENVISAAYEAQWKLNTSTHEGSLVYQYWNKVIADATGQLTELKNQLLDVNKEIEKATMFNYQRYLSNLTSWLEHYETIGQITNEQYLKYLRQIDLSKLSLQDRWKYEEEIYNKRRQELQNEIDLVKQAYDERMQEIEDELKAEEEATQKKIENKQKEIDTINEETDAQIAAIQKLIDALDVQDEQSNREEAERQHNQKLADLQKEYQYHELRTGLEHQQAMADIQKQIAEEEHNWELQKQEWARQDQRDAYQQQIEALREQAKARQDAIQQEINDLQKASNKKKEELQGYYNDVQKLIDNKMVDMLASLSMIDEQWYEQGLRWMQKLAEGIRDGQTELPSGAKNFFEDVKKTYDDQTQNQPTPVATFLPQDIIIRNGRAYAWSRLIGERLGLPVRFDDKNWLVMLGSKGLSPDFIEGDRAYLGLRRVGEFLGYKVEYDDEAVKFLPKAHIGAYVKSSGIAELLQGERVLSPRLTVSFDRLANVLTNFPNIPERISLMQQGYGNLDRLADRIVAAIERRNGIQIGNLFNAENVEFTDSTDMEVFSRELSRTVKMLQTARGR